MIRIFSYRILSVLSEFFSYYYYLHLISALRRTYVSLFS